MSAMVDGPSEAPILLIGMAPGREEVVADRPFVGRSGRFLWSLFKHYASLDRSDFYIVNAIGEFPKGKRGEITPEQFDKYWDQFNEAVGKSTARVAVALGKDALWRFTGIPGGIEDWRGYIIGRGECLPMTRVSYAEVPYKTNTPLHKKGDPRRVKVTRPEQPIIPWSVNYILPTLHPAGVMRSGFATAPALKLDLVRVRRALEGALNKVRTHYVEFPVLVTDGSPVAADIETGGIEGGIVRLGIANSLETYTLPWGAQAQSAARAELDQPGRILIFHNAAFDVPRLEAAGVPCTGQLWDTMLAAALVQPDLYKGLNEVGSLYLDCHRWKHESEQHPVMYNAFDASRTLELYHVLRGELEVTGQLGLFEGTIMPAVRTLARMAARGMLVDPVRKDEWIARLQQEYDVALKDWQARSGLSVTSGKRVLNYLYGSDGLGLPVQYHKYGSETGEEVAIRVLATEYPEHADALMALLTVRGLGKDLKTYAQVGLSTDGCVHPNFLPANKDTERRDQEGHVVGKGLAGTWRITAKNPNIQNQPTEARRMYVARPGCALVEFDYNQIEARILAAVSSDEALQRAIDEGLHRSNMALLGVDKTRAKNAFYGWSYMAGVPTLVKTFKQHGFNVTWQECAAMLVAFNRQFRVARAYLERRARLGEEQFYVENAFGLRRYFQNKKCGPAAANHEPQSDTACIIWRVLPQVDAEASRVGGSLLATIHDSILVELPRVERLMWNVGRIRAILEQPFNEIRPGFWCPVGIKIGQNWGEMQEVTSTTAS